MKQSSLKTFVITYKEGTAEESTGSYTAVFRFSDGRSVIRTSYSLPAVSCKVALLLKNHSGLMNLDDTQKNRLMGTFVKMFTYVNYLDNSDDGIISIKESFE